MVNGGKIPPKHRTNVQKTSHGSTATVTIVLRGLMVFHPDPAREYFEAGILPAPGHRFVLPKDAQTAERSSNPATWPVVEDRLGQDLKVCLFTHN